jgi:hypothetical protein
VDRVVDSCSRSVAPAVNHTFDSKAIPHFDIQKMETTFMLCFFACSKTICSYFQCRTQFVFSLVFKIDGIFLLRLYAFSSSNFLRFVHASHFLLGRILMFNNVTQYTQT